MSAVNALYLLQNQNKLFLSKTLEWVDATDLSILFRSRYKDEAINQMVEINSKDINQRIRCVECGASANGQPLIDPDIMPEPLPKPELEEQPLAAEDSESGVFVQDPQAGNLDNAEPLEQEEPQLALVD